MFHIHYSNVIQTYYTTITYTICFYISHMRKQQRHRVYIENINDTPVYSNLKEPQNTQVRQFL